MNMLAINLNPIFLPRYCGYHVVRYIFTKNNITYVFVNSQINIGVGWLGVEMKPSQKLRSVEFTCPPTST